MYGSYFIECGNQTGNQIILMSKTFISYDIIKVLTLVKESLNDFIEEFVNIAPVMKKSWLSWKSPNKMCLLRQFYH